MSGFWFLCYGFRFLVLSCRITILGSRSLVLRSGFKFHNPYSVMPLTWVQIPDSLLKPAFVYLVPCSMFFIPFTGFSATQSLFLDSLFATFYICWKKIHDKYLLKRKRKVKNNALLIIKPDVIWLLLRFVFRSIDEFFPIGGILLFFW